MSRSVSRGMLQVRGVTYRIERTEPHCYCVVRLLDDTEVGTFRTLPQLRISSARIELTLLRDIVRAALRSARTSAVMHVAPVFQPDEDERPVSASSPSAVGNMSAATDSAAASSVPAAPANPTMPPVRTPSSAPPPAAPAMA
ncbi:MAG: hypothetical protein ABUL60_26920 [Myxococcales bacterium]